MSSLKARLLTAAVGIPVAVLILVLSEFFPWIMSPIISILCSFMTYEILSAKKLHKKLAVFIPCLLFAFVEPLLITTAYVLIPIYLMSMILFFVMIIKSDDVRFNDVVFAIINICLITFGMSSILLISDILNGRMSFVFALTIGVAWFSDGGAYFAGVFLGKHKLCPKVSPNKTVEGLIGGLVTGTLVSILIGFIYSFIYTDISFNYLALTVVGLFGSTISVLGDLTFSQIKRYCGIKDYGSLFPGHGGILDRFDSVIFISLFVYLFCKFFPLITV